MSDQTDVAAATAPPQLGGDLIYEYTVQLTDMTEYGVALADLLAGETSIPAEGARFDFPFEGVSAGPRLKGTVKGVDYANIRADGRVELHLHAEITDDAGKKIALFADGVLGLDLPNPARISPVRENVTLTSSEPEYAWCNQMQIWATGAFDVEKSEVHLTGYAV
jgi:hypothetical protein